jgi:hypothetical protein
VNNYKDSVTEEFLRDFTSSIPKIDIGRINLQHYAYYLLSVAGWFILVNTRMLTLFRTPSLGLGEKLGLGS